MPRDRDKPRRKRPAYPKVGTGEDFPAKRPGTKVGEDRSGGKIMQSTRGTQARRNKARRRFEANPVPPATPRRGEPFRARTPVWPHGRPTGKRVWPFSAGVRGKPTKRNPWPL